MSNKLGKPFFYNTDTKIGQFATPNELKMIPFDDDEDEEEGEGEEDGEVIDVVDVDDDDDGGGGGKDKDDRISEPPLSCQ